MSASHRFSRFGLHEMLLGEGKGVKSSKASASAASSSSSRPRPQEPTPMEVEPQSETVHHSDERKTYAQRIPAKGLEDFLRWQASLTPNRYQNPEGATKPAADPRWPDHKTEEQKRWEEAQIWVDKNLIEWGDDNAQIFAHMEHHGLHVILEIPSLDEGDFQPLLYPDTHYTEVANIYGKDETYDVYVWDHGKHKYVSEKKATPLLMIKTLPREGKFIHRIGRPVTDEERKWDYHISMSFTHEIHRFDLRNSEDGVRLGKETYNRLRARFNGKEAVLHGHMGGSTFVVDEMLVEGETIPVPDEVVMLHNAGRYCNRPIHVSM